MNGDPFIYGDGGPGLDPKQGRHFFVPTFPNSEDSLQYERLSRSGQSIPGEFVLAFAREASQLARPDVDYEQMITPGIQRGAFTHDQLVELRGLLLEGALRVSTAKIYGNGGELHRDALVDRKDVEPSGSRSIMAWLRMAATVENKSRDFSAVDATLPQLRENPS